MTGKEFGKTAPQCDKRAKVRPFSRDQECYNLLFS